MEILYISLLEIPRKISLRSVNPSTQALGGYMSTLTILNTSMEYTSDDNVLAYRPYYDSYWNAGGNTAIVFVNLEAAIPCYRGNEIAPACQLFTYDGGTFQYGNAFIQSSDDGSHLEIFSILPETATYGFGVSGCSTFDRACVSDFKAFLVCLLPPALNQCDRSI